MRDRTEQTPRAWRFTPRGLAVRIFLTCWLIYTLHWATDVVREVYPAISLGDHFSFRVDEYQHLHPDLFEKPGYGWHINNNPGASMLAAIPYAFARPIIDRVSGSVMAKRHASGQVDPPEFATPRANAKAFFAEAWRRGLDVKLGLAAFVTQAFCMAPLSAFGAVLMFLILRELLRSDRSAVWLTLLYAFGTPVFFRTGFLNQNLLLGQFAFASFFLLWKPGPLTRLSEWTRYFLAGIAAGFTVLIDYSGVVFIPALFAYGAVKLYRHTTMQSIIRSSLAFVLGSLGPVLLLCFYQWKSFGNPFLPAQNWMPPEGIQYIERGYQGFSGPQLDLLWALLFDHHYGLFICAPLLTAALFAPLVQRSGKRTLPRLEETFLLLLFAGIWLFFSANNFTHLQSNTGIRYMTPIVPFLFIPAAIVLMRMRISAVYAIAVLSITISWALAMYRQVIGPLGMFDPMAHLFTQGFTLPVLTTLSQTGGAYGDFFKYGASPLPLFALSAAVLYGLWSVRFQSVIRRDRTNLTQIQEAPPEIRVAHQV